MNSRLVTGTVLHARSHPVAHRFRYPVYFYLIDLDEIPELDRSLPLFGYNRLRPVSLWDRDYLRPGPGSIRKKLGAVAREAGRPAPERIWLVTSARVLNYVFNPVSFFYCYDEQNRLDWVLAQVNNTFGEMHLYPLTERLPPRRPGEIHYRAEKAFHVSPFFRRLGRYDFYLGDPADGRLDIMIHYRQGEQVVFAARLRGTAQALSNSAIAAKLLRHPLTASMTMPRILWQAARLRFQRHLPYIPKPAPASDNTVRQAPPKLRQRLARRIVLSFLGRMKTGGVTVVDPDGRLTELGPGGNGRAVLTVRDHRFYSRCLRWGEIGFGDAYMEGEWTTNDLAALLTGLAQNQSQLRDRELFLSLLGRLPEHIRHLGRPNTVAGSRKNIEAHYDLSNDFFSLFLDPTMTYSCGLYLHEGESLQEAQAAKNRAIIRKAGIAAGDHVLEIGCGWGGFAIQAVRTTGCRVSGMTISRRQLQLARERIRLAGLSGRIRLEYLDYRHLEGVYDRIVSIEMLEAVGHAGLGRFFAVCSRALRPGGTAVIQVIVIPHERYGRYRRSSDWIRKHIFPGGHLPSVPVIEQAVRGFSDLKIVDVESIGPHYARTLKDWGDNFSRNRERIRKLGFGERFLRMWEYYLASCQAGFATGIIDDVQMILHKPYGEGR